MDKDNARACWSKIKKRKERQEIKYKKYYINFSLIYRNASRWEYLI